MTSKVILRFERVIGFTASLLIRSRRYFARSSILKCYNYTATPTRPQPTVQCGHGWFVHVRLIDYSFKQDARIKIFQYNNVYVEGVRIVSLLHKLRIIGFKIKDYLL